MTSRFDCQNEQEKAAGLEAARAAIAAKQCVVLPTDTVYGIAADAFSPQAVATLLAAKGRGRTMPPPVLIPHAATLDGLATEVNGDARALAEAFWPGPLTLILRSQPSLTWDLGETRGTVALRIPDDPLARELLEATGPLAVSSANRTGNPAAATAAEAEEQLGGAVAVYLEDGRRPVAGESLASTIVDCTGPVPAVVRQGALPLEELRRVVPAVLGLGEERLGEEPATQP
ncbi:threonylcarbamoyl-AMP synthase [Zafaria cholistanensis]|uniref:L-threonylcarbamoyladenylate synthase n=1 Tax=Zafaria cholistanensis TaxID=1682741 RepID=A0A5A7NTU5_9MICC|nr:L-threonylcarbamoyladenylate synthase [Zafaria cholistanensis]GER24189.1 threonylcarbamoyl-AMP synthase [Zafaria cholistanensis]